MMCSTSCVISSRTRRAAIVGAGDTSRARTRTHAYSPYHVPHTWILTLVRRVCVFTTLASLGNPYVGNDDATVLDATRHYDELRLDLDAILLDAHARVLAGTT